MSDTHGNSGLMHEVAEAMLRRFGAEVLFHLGDDYRDAEDLALAGYVVRRVPGLWCPEYQDSRVPKRLVETFDGVTVSCAHAERDLRHTERAAAVVLTGHTHTARIQLLGWSLYVNPGHLKAFVARNERASYAILETRPADVRAAIHDAATHEVRFGTTVRRDNLA
jgi:predicted phosphodiesterase